MAASTTTPSLGFSCSVCESFSRLVFLIYELTNFCLFELVLIVIAKTYKYSSYGREIARRLLRFQLTSSFIHKSHNITFLNHCRGVRAVIELYKFSEGPNLKQWRRDERGAEGAKGVGMGRRCPLPTKERSGEGTVPPSPEILSCISKWHFWVVRCVRFFFYNWNLWKYA